MGTARQDNTQLQFPQLVDIDTIAAFLGVSVRHVRRLRAERRIPYVKWGHLLRFDLDEIRQWVDEARVAARPAIVATRR